MKTIPKKLLSLCIALVACTFLHAQLSVAKIIVKDADKSKLGFGLFAFYDIPINEFGNSSIRLEIMDLVYFPKKTEEDYSKGYFSAKLGYRYIFSETRTGFYVEPQVGYCRVAKTSQYQTEATYGDGVALAMEAGYSLEVGQQGNTVNLGLKLENDRAGAEHTISSIGLRLSYSFGLFKRKE